jgi:hypothetical protein
LHGKRYSAWIDRGADRVAGQRACDEDDVAVAARDPLPPSASDSAAARGLLLGLRHWLKGSLRIGSCRNLRKTASRRYEVGSSGGGESSGGSGALERDLRKALDDLRTAGKDQVASWRSTLEDTTEDVCVEVAKLAVRAMSSAASVDEVAEEVLKRRKSLRERESGGSES